MNCKFIWNNLPKQIKEKLDITLKFNWNRIPTEINEVLRQLETENNSVYLQYFKPKYKTNWFFLLRDLNKLCQTFDGGDTPEVDSKAFYLSVNESCELSNPVTLYRKVGEEMTGDGFIYYTDKALTQFPNERDLYYFIDFGVTKQAVFINGICNLIVEVECIRQ